MYWCADTDINLVEEKLPQIGGRLRHELSQLQNGKVPHINFIYGNYSVGNHYSNFKITIRLVFIIKCPLFT